MNLSRQNRITFTKPDPSAKNNPIKISFKEWSNQLASIVIPLERHLRFYVINFRKLIIDTDTKSLFLLRMADMHA
jgi:hypothetical protein